MVTSSQAAILFSIFVILLFVSPVHAFGAGNIASISAIEGKNWRHGDIEDMLKTVACVKGHKWTSMMIKRVYFGNWLRDYSQAMDTGTLTKAQPETIRILVWVLSFLSFGYATAEFEVTAERLGVYRPEEHIDNPKNYNDDKDARQVDPRLRGPIRPIELEVDPGTGMKNYIANTRGDWATSAAYVKYSFERSIHHGRQYADGRGIFNKGDDEELAEALRCLGQGLHCLEDFGAHSNYVELALRELGMTNVFPHTGTATAINLRGKHTFPLVTGTFGMVDFFHSVLGEASDHFTQSEINEMDDKLGGAQAASQSSSPLGNFTGLLSKVPGTKDLATEAESLQASSQARAAQQGEASRSAGDFNPQASWHDPNAGYQHDFHQQSQWQQEWGQQQQQQPPPPQWDQNQHQSQWTQPPAQNQWDQQQGQSYTDDDESQRGSAIQNIDPVKTAKQIYPILVFRDKVVRSINAIISKIPGLEALVEKITETLTVFILSLLAPFIRPLIDVLTKQLQASSSAVISSSGKHQYEPWTDPHCTDPTHSMLSKDHFSNILNEPAGAVAAEILKFVAPRVIYAWDHASVPVQQVLDDCMQVFHHPAVRNHNTEVHRDMFDVVQRWARNRHGGGHDLNDLLSSEGVRSGRNHTVKPGDPAGHSHGAMSSQHAAGGSSNPASSGHGSHANPQGAPHGGTSGFNPLAQFTNVPGVSNVNSTINKLSSFVPGGLGKFTGGGSQSGRRGLDENDTYAGAQSRDLQPEPGTGYDYTTYGDQQQGGSAAPVEYPPPAGYEAYTHDGGADDGGHGYRPQQNQPQQNQPQQNQPQQNQPQPPYGYPQNAPPGASADYYGGQSYYQ